MKSAVTLSRRSLLGLAALTLAACKKGSSAAAPRVDPDAAALTGAHAAEQSLIAAYDRAIASSDAVAAGRLTAERALHVRHLAALGGPSATGSPSATAPPTTQLGTLLRDSADALRDAAVAATQGRVAALLASIAASHEVMSHD